MLHEVASELARRSDIELIEIQGHADGRGSGDYNAQLSERRAQRVLEWLVEHGIARERLQIAAHGEAALVEAGESEEHHVQNRRVVFRVVRVREAQP
jgi:outer membrane protein OmpA-like peptidoglycan-associated protein